MTDNRPDALVIAGIYDRSVPPEDAVTVLDSCAYVRLPKDLLRAKEQVRSQQYKVNAVCSREGALGHL